MVNVNIRSYEKTHGNQTILDYSPLWVSPLKKINHSDMQPDMLINVIWRGAWEDKILPINYAN